MSPSRVGFWVTQRAPELNEQRWLKWKTSLSLVFFSTSHSFGRFVLPLPHDLPLLASSACLLPHFSALLTRKTQRRRRSVVVKLNTGEKTRSVYESEKEQWREEAASSGSYVWKMPCAAAIGIVVWLRTEEKEKKPISDMYTRTPRHIGGNHHDDDEKKPEEEKKRPNSGIVCICVNDSHSMTMMPTQTREGSRLCL